MSLLRYRTPMVGKSFDKLTRPHVNLSLCGSIFEAFNENDSTD